MGLRTANARLSSRPALRVAISHEYRAPARAELAGGDVVAFNRHDDGSTTLLMGDLSAKAEEGAELAAWLASAFHLACVVFPRPSSILKQLNAMLVETLTGSSRDIFATAFICRFFPMDSYLVYSAAGAEPPILFSNAKSHRTLPPDGIALGVEKGASYRDVVMPIGPESAFIAFTDGITESQHASVTERLGTHSVVAAIRSSRDRSAAFDCHEILAEISKFNGGVYSDDATLLVVQATAS